MTDDAEKAKLVALSVMAQGQLLDVIWPRRVPTQPKPADPMRGYRSMRTGTGGSWRAR